ncbi:hypothetical protein ACO2Q1_02640 [Brevundimonas sp. VNH65]|uniref:hypothetical protein n=1 Tax=Brevundimonas sp. VNH65 TaxID=3400917 RepID=UPI003C023114
MPQDPLHSLLSAVGDELGDMRIDLDDLAALTSELMADVPDAARETAMVRAQAYDLLLQRLDELSGLLAALGAGAPVDLSLHALSLSDLSARLGGAAAAHDPASDGGEVHLF